MAATIRGKQILKFGTNTLTGYVVEGEGESVKGEEYLVIDEGGDPCTQVTGYGIMYDRTYDVVPLATVTTPPLPGDVMTIGTTKFVVISIDKKRAIREAEKWSIKGNSFPNIALS